MPWSSEDLAYFHAGHTSFLLQNFFIKEQAENFMMHLLVEDVDSWWSFVQEGNVAQKISLGE